MNILFFHNTSDLYGAGRVLLNVAGNLAENNHRAIVIVSEDGPLVEQLQKRNVEVRIIRLGILRRKYFSVSGIINRVQVMRHAWKQLNQLLSDEKIDIIFSNTTGVLIGAFLAKKRRIPHIWHVHEIITKPAMFTHVVGYLLKKYSDQVVVVSDAVKDHWKTHVPAHLLNRIYNGIDITPFSDKSSTLRKELSISSDQVLVGMIGRVNKIKGQQYLLDIAKQTIERHPDVIFIMVGDAYPGNEYLVDDLNERIDNEGLTGRVINLGYREDIVNVINALDIFILPSILPDSFPTVILEAMAAGKPVVATAQGGAREMVEEGTTGILIPLDNAAAAADKLSLLISGADKRQDMGKRGYQRLVTHFSLESFNQQFLNLVQLIATQKFDERSSDFNVQENQTF